MGATESAAAQTDGTSDREAEAALVPETDDAADSPVDDNRPEERTLRELVVLVEQRLAALNDPTGRTRRRFVALLQGTEKKNASKRLALRARKFAQQGGRCARCGQMFNRTRKISARIEEALPLVCAQCERADLIAGTRT